MRDVILNAAQDTMAGFLYYDRKEDEELPVGAIETAIVTGEVSIADILEVFSKALELTVSAHGTRVHSPG